ncbi:hypothetical protein CCH79_00005509 [Gambusia affinis]|uniref:Neurogenic mastermind-like N-terminal domain-containing protein n=1 Tax=Gambusia affinis TaxID=33528 RepID=A0A315V7E2_GAMAF|nr:hypothetical protein CCH79_00005509 [Gambusia affinis]
MADFVTPRHSAVMERLRRRIELFRQHHNNCETRYDGAAPERLELDRQHTISLHQRLLQNKAKRASKHRQPQPTAEQDAPRAPGVGVEGSGTAAEQSRNTTRQVLHDVVKRKLEGGGSPLSNGVCDGLPANKKACLENGTGPDAKPGLTDRTANGPRRAEPPDPEPDFHQKEMKQEPEDILPIMPPSVAGGNGLFLDLNLNEQEWKELMEELNCSSPATVLNYKNTIPLSHYEAGPGGPGPPRAPSGQGQDKAALLSLLRQQKQSSMSFRPHLTHPQDQNFSASPHVSGPAMTSGPGNNAMAAAVQGPNAMAGNHGNAAFLRDPMAALKQQQFMQRQLLAEQEKQRQDQQLQRHLTRPPPQYQDQAGPAAGQNPFSQQNVAPFTGSSQPISNMGSMGSPAPGARMFAQNQGMMGMSMAQGAGPGGSVAAPPAANQADISLPSCGGGGASQPRIPKMASGSFGGRGVPGLNQQMMQNNMAAQQRAPLAAQTQHQPANQSGPVLPDLAAYGAPQSSGRQALPCNQGYQVSRGGGQQQQQLSFGYNAAAGSFAAESELVDSLLKGQSTQEWMADLDELLAGHT